MGGLRRRRPGRGHRGGHTCDGSRAARGHAPDQATPGGPGRRRRPREHVVCKARVAAARSFASHPRSPAINRQQPKPGRRVHHRSFARHSSADDVRAGVCVTRAVFSPTLRAETRPTAWRARQGVSSNRHGGERAINPLAPAPPDRPHSPARRARVVLSALQQRQACVLTESVTMAWASIVSAARVMVETCAEFLSARRNRRRRYAERAGTSSASRTPSRSSARSTAWSSGRPSRSSARSTAWSA